MSMFAKSLLLLGMALIFSGCAYQSGWTPAVTSYGDPNAANIARDQINCRVLAKQAAGDPVTEIGKGALIGGAAGAAAGAAIGAAAGSPGVGAAVGAAAGGIGGLVKQGFGIDHQYKEAFINCMRGRGHNLL